MPRRREVPKRKWLPDPKYRSSTLTRFMNVVMLDGKKSVAESIVYGALETVADKTREEPLKVFERALENCKPNVEVKSRRVGGATYQVPLEVAASRQESLSIRWIVSFARARKGTPMHIALANEIRDAASNSGNAVRRRDEMHKMAQANRAFAHFRW